MRGTPGACLANMKPLIFLRSLYCVDSNYRELRGSAGVAQGCPTTAAGSRSFRKQNPALFSASGLRRPPLRGGVAAESSRRTCAGTP